MNSSEVTSQKKSIILFDGVCNLCDQSINFILATDRKKTMKFASLQSTIGQELLLSHGLDSKSFDSIVFIQDGKVYTRSSAFVRILANLGGVWSLCNIFLIVPKFMRDFFYGIVSKNRYQWFGKRDQCRIPTQEEKDRFL